MMSKALDVPFPRNRLAMLRSSIIHTHLLRSWKMKNTVIVWRDGRDVLVSWYFHYFFLKDKNRIQIKYKDNDDILNNLPRFIEYEFRKKKNGFSWAEFVDQWHCRSDVFHVKYEDLLRDAAGELVRVVNQLPGSNITIDRAKEISEEFSFEKQSYRKPGIENKTSFLRKGIAGDWKNRFNKKAKELFHFYAGSQLIKLGYEKDDSWVHKDNV
jgi:hypothetical protein